MRKILGLDLGTNSIGWAVVTEEQKDDRSYLSGIDGAGSRIIPMSADQLGDFEKGNTISQTKERTGYRGTRRLRERFLLRRERLHRTLGIMGFLPKHYAESIDEFGKFHKGTEPKIEWRKGENGKYEFIFQSSFYEMLDKKASLKNAHERAKRRVQNYARLSPDDIINLAHDEYIENGVQRLRANLEEILNRQDRIELNELTLLGMDRVNAYISLLFLTVDSDYDLMQDEFYGDLYVVRYEGRVNENAEDLSDEDDNIFDAVNNVTNIIKDEVNFNGTVEV